MKFTCSRVALLDAMKIASSAVAARTTKPILSNVKAVASGDTLTLTAQDMEIGIRYELRGVDTKAHGEAILAADRLNAILQTATDEEATIDANDDGAKVKIGTSKFDMPGYPVNEFPDLPAVDDDGNCHEVTAGDLRDAIRRTVFAADKKDSTRFALAGILWEADGNVMRLVATDSKRLAVCERPATIHGDAPDAKRSHLVPAKALGLIERNLADAGETVRVVLRPNEAMFQTGRAMVYTRLLEGRFPPWRDIVKQTEKAAKERIAIPAESFLLKVRQASVMADDESKRLNLAFADGKCTLTAKGAETGSSEVVMDLPEYSGAGVTISLDPQYLTDFLRVADGNVVMRVADGSKPAMFEAGDGWKVMVMPLAG